MTIQVEIKEFFAKQPRKWPLVRITKSWIVVRYNNVATGKYDRKSGYSAGAFRDRGSSTPSKVINLAELNKLADDNGGIYEPKKVQDNDQ